MFSLSFVGGSKSAEGGPNPLADLNGGGGGPYPLADLDRGGPNPLGYRHSHRSITLRYGKAPIKTHGIKKKLHSGARKVNPRFLPDLKSRFPYFELYPYSKTLGYPLDF